jgi:hypothetical protein
MSKKYASVVIRKRSTGSVRRVYFATIHDACVWALKWDARPGYAVHALWNPAGA